MDPLWSSSRIPPFCGVEDTMWLVLAFFYDSFVNHISVDKAGTCCSRFDILWIIPNSTFFAVNWLSDTRVDNTKLWVGYINDCSVWTLEMHFTFFNLHLAASNSRCS